MDTTIQADAASAWIHTEGRAALATLRETFEPKGFALRWGTVGNRQTGPGFSIELSRQGVQAMLYSLRLCTGPHGTQPAKTVSRRGEDARAEPFWSRSGSVSLNELDSRDVVADFLTALREG